MVFILGEPMTSHWILVVFLQMIPDYVGPYCTEIPHLVVYWHQFVGVECNIMQHRLR